MAERKIILLLSGEIAAGKTTLAKNLEEKFGFKVLKTRKALKELAKKKLKGEEPDRTFLQKFGTILDEQQDGKWVLDYFQNDRAEYCCVSALLPAWARSAERLRHLCFCILIKGRFLCLNIAICTNNCSASATKSRELPHTRNTGRNTLSCTKGH